MRGLLTYILVSVTFIGYSQTARDLVRSGNENYTIDSLNSAMDNYEHAMELAPKMEEAKFNLGDAQYRAGKFADAAQTFNELGISSTDKTLKSDAHFNEGNSLIQAQKFEEAMGAFKNSMKASPSNSKARYNYEFARQMLQEQQKQEQENKDDKNKDDQNKDDQNKDDKNKDKNEDDQNKDDQNKDDKNKNDKEDKDKDADNKDQDKEDQDKNKDKSDPEKEDSKDPDKGDENEGKGNPEDEDQKQPEAQPQPGQMSKADAERLLKAMEDNEKKTRDKVALKKAKATKSKNSDKDW